MTKLQDKLRQLVQQLGKKGSKPLVSDTMEQNDLNTAIIDETAVQKLMQHLMAAENNYSCSETFDLLDEYVELAVTKEDAALLMPLVQKHIAACPDCCDRYEALLRILQTES